MLNRLVIPVCLFLSAFSLNVRPQALEPQMIFVKGGVFRMGSNSGGSDERPVHEVAVSSFFISRYEVTQAEWYSVMIRDTTDRYFGGCDSCPVERVTWYHAMEYIERLNSLTGKNYRLPTEAEWEYAARGGVNSRGYRFSGSNKADSVAWTDGNSGNRVHPVGRKKPNELGLYDMSGNVFEWCADWYLDTFYKISPKEDPSGPETGEKKVMRGGSWFFDRCGTRCTDRDYGNPLFRYGYVGFRLCLSEGD